MHQNGNLFIYNDALEIIGINRQTLAWGVATIVGAVIVLGIPAAMYLAKNCKCSFISYVSSLLFLAGAVLVNTRSAMIVGASFFLICAVIVCAKGKNRWFNRIYTLILIAFVCGVLIYIDTRVIPLNEFFDNIRNILRLDDIENDSRIPLFKNGIEDFRSSWLFGVGFNDGGYTPDVVTNNVYSRMYHNIIIQFLGSMGIVGALAFLVHIKHLGEVTVRRFSLDKLLLIFVPLMIISMSMVDNFFFYANFQIIYSVFLAIAEISLEQSREKSLSEHRRAEEGKKPRVAFTYVEAGKGHIVPEEAVQSCFEKKYGNEVEIIGSSFYNETGDPNMKKTETLFIKTVKNQNKSFIAGMMCRIGTWFCGDALSLTWVMACTPSGIRSRRRAMKHLRELDCDVLFTTHWSIAFYTAHMKNAPYSILLCPDPYSNGMFNVDVNNFLITSEEGKKQVDRRRMYAGGNVNAVPLPIRQDAKKYLGMREELRQKHGISPDSFTVVLLDGGYGMARIEKTIKYLLKTRSDITVISLCGTNDALKKRLDTFKTSESVKLLAISYCEDIFEYIALADLFCGKSGANSLAEAAYFGVPIMITKCITYIEKHNKNYYTRKIKGALYVPSAYLAAKKILRFASDRSLLEPYRKNISKLYGISGEEIVADIIYDAAKNTKNI
jgi:UDP-N-acetylglucosamine:LPS N-acetylglucosamine transferase